MRHDLRRKCKYILTVTFAIVTSGLIAVSTVTFTKSTISLRARAAIAVTSRRIILRTTASITHKKLHSTKLMTKSLPTRNVFQDLHAPSVVTRRRTFLPFASTLDFQQKLLILITFAIVCAEFLRSTVVTVITFSSWRNRTFRSE
eukprot:UN14302